MVHLRLTVTWQKESLMLLSRPSRNFLHRGLVVYNKMQLQRNPFSIRACARILHNWSRATWNLEIRDFANSPLVLFCVIWCVFVDRDTQRWQSFGSPVPIDEEHQSGEGSDKQRCSLVHVEWVGQALQIGNNAYCLRFVCILEHTRDTRHYMLCKLDLATWKWYDEYDVIRGSWWDIPCSSTAPPPLMAWTGRLPFGPVHSIWASGFSTSVGPFL